MRASREVGFITTYLQDLGLYPCMYNIQNGDAQASTITKSIKVVLAECAVRAKLTLEIVSVCALHT